nr:MULTISPECIES: hypothetical protein [unclassified Actinopolyspora]
MRRATPTRTRNSEAITSPVWPRTAASTGPDEHGQEIESGRDLGLSAFTVDQHGRVIDPRLLRRAERTLKRAQRAVSRKQRGSIN